jgi:drug/metabolite transporter (DMT)-like permease
MPARPASWKILAAFAVIYVVWGSTFLAIRIGVEQVPPLLLASMRFIGAGVLMFAWTFSRREALPTRRQWLSIALLAFLIFVVDYGLLFWAEQRIPSGIAAVMLATIPVFTALAEILILGTRKMTWRLAFALLAGLAGVAVLTLRGLGVSGAPVETISACAIIFGALTWSIASALTRRLPLPSSKLTSSATQMTMGGAMLFLASLGRGELRGFHPAAVTPAAWWSLVYLILAGSILGFTVYLWLLHHESPTHVSTYAYVNPVVAVFLGYFFASEPLGMRTVLGSALVIVGVILITTTPAAKPSLAGEPT